MNTSEELEKLRQELEKLRPEVIRIVRAELAHIIGSAGAPVSAQEIHNAFRRRTDVDFQCLSRGLGHLFFGSLLNSAEFGDLVETCYPDEEQDGPVICMYRLAERTEMDNLVGKLKLLTCLHQMYGDEKPIAYPRLQSAYEREYGMILDEKELQKYFLTGHIRDILNNYMHEDVLLSTDTNEPGSIYIQLAKPWARIADETVHFVKKQRELDKADVEAKKARKRATKQQRGKAPPIRVNNPAKMVHFLKNDKGKIPPVKPKPRQPIYKPRAGEDLEGLDCTIRTRAPIQDDSEGHLIYHIGQIIENKYEIVKRLGKGGFGKVVQVKDLKDPKGPHRALKIIKNTAGCRKEASLEIAVLRKLKELDPSGRHFIIQMLNSFDYCGHTCLLFDLMGLSVHAFQKMNDYRPYPMDQARYIAYQLMHAVKFLHDHQLTHNDLKPENIVFVNSEIVKTGETQTLKDATVRLIDLGSATFDDGHHSTIVATRHYRAPEVILELGWAQPCDVWAIGCTMFELYTGHLLFMTHENLEHLAMMERILGRIPSRMAWKTKTNYFYRGRLNWYKNSWEGRDVLDECKPLMQYMRADSEEHRQLFNLIRRMLAYEPSSRICLLEALGHVYFHRLGPELRASVDGTANVGAKDNGIGRKSGGAASVGPSTH